MALNIGNLDGMEKVGGVDPHWFEDFYNGSRPFQDNQKLKIPTFCIFIQQSQLKMRKIFT